MACMGVRNFDDLPNDIIYQIVYPTLESIVLKMHFRFLFDKDRPDFRFNPENIFFEEFSNEKKTIIFFGLTNRRYRNLILGTDTMSFTPRYMKILTKQFEASSIETAIKTALYFGTSSALKWITKNQFPDKTVNNFFWDAFENNTKVLTDKKVMTFLLKNGAQVDCKKFGCTPLISIARGDNIPLVEFLLEHKADINMQSDEGKNTALLIATSHGNIPMAKKLLDCGADTDLRDSEGKSAYDVAVEKGEFGDFLRRHFDNSSTPWFNSHTETDEFNRSPEAQKYNKIRDLLLAQNVEI